MSIPVLNADRKEATEFTLKANEKVADYLDINTDNCYVDELALAEQGCILPLDDLVIKHDTTGEAAWDVSEYSFYVGNKILHI